MKTALKPVLKSNTFCPSKSCVLEREKESSSADFKFYQKLFVIFISPSTILIFPESPREIENLCKDYNSIVICNVW